nr:hypothetical protein [Burkholderia ubonensis]
MRFRWITLVLPGTMKTPDDVAQAALFLCSPAAPRRPRGSSPAWRCRSTAACWPGIA